MNSRSGRNIMRGCMVLFLLFNAGAIYYSTIEPASIREALTILYVLSVGCAMSLLPFRRGMGVATVISLSVFAWYLEDPPRNDRDWAQEYAIPAAIAIDGQTISITNIRDFSYRSPTDAVPHYYNADFRLDQLVSVDLVSSHWAGDAIAHIFLTFGFQDGRHLAISIETRRQKGFAFSVIAGFFRHFELIYVVADERDLIGVRTDIRRERVYLYPLRLTPQSREALFLSYVNKIQELSEYPEWYNTFFDNCTTGILARAQAPGRAMLNWRVVLSGHMPEFVYRRGLMDTDLSFPALRRQSLIIRPDSATITPDYSQDIRKNLPSP